MASGEPPQATSGPQLAGWPQARWDMATPQVHGPVGNALDTFHPWCPTEPGPLHRAGLCHLCFCSPEHMSGKKRMRGSSRPGSTWMSSSVAAPAGDGWRGAGKDVTPWVPRANPMW